MQGNYYRRKERRDANEVNFSLKNYIRGHHHLRKSNHNNQTKGNQFENYTSRPNGNANNNKSYTNKQTTSDRKEDTEEICVSRLDPNICIQEEKTHNVKPPTMTTTSQLEASHCMLTERLVAILEKATRIRGGHTTFQAKVTTGPGRIFHCCCHKDGPESTPTDEFWAHYAH